LSIKIFANFISFADIPASEATFKIVESAKLAAANLFLYSIYSYVRAKKIYINFKILLTFIFSTTRL
jgi:hypothetical protein